MKFHGIPKIGEKILDLNQMERLLILVSRTKTIVARNGEVKIITKIIIFQNMTD